MATDTKQCETRHRGRLFHRFSAYASLSMKCLPPFGHSKMRGERLGGEKKGASAATLAPPATLGAQARKDRCIVLHILMENLAKVVRLGSASFFLGVVSGYLFLLFIPRARLKAYLSKTIVRRFVEYFGNVGLGEDGSGSSTNHEVTTGRA